MIMTKYNIGDRVKVREDLVVHERYYMEDGEIGDSFIADMAQLKGQIVTINAISPTGKYIIMEDNGAYNWTDEMFECKLDVDECIKLDVDKRLDES